MIIPDYVFAVPICILPLIIKAFFDARLGLFTHVLTVLLIGFIVPNSFEFVFITIMAGIITIQSVAQLYRRANLFISVASNCFGLFNWIYCIHYNSEGSILRLAYSTCSFYAKWFTYAIRSAINLYL